MKDSLNSVLVMALKIHVGHREAPMSYALKTKGILLALNTEKFTHKTLIKKLAQKEIATYPGWYWSCMGMQRKVYRRKKKFRGVNPCLI